MWHIYVLQCSDGSFYTGITKDVLRRLSEHNSGKGYKYVRSRRPAKVLCSAEVSHSVGEARSLEMKFKRLSRKAKEEFLAAGLDSFVELFVRS